MLTVAPSRSELARRPPYIMTMGAYTGTWVVVEMLTDRAYSMPTAA